MFRRFCTYGFFTLTALLVAGVGAQAYAQDIAGVGGMVCRVATALGGNVASGIGILAIIFLAVGAFFGKVNWGIAALTAVAVYTITHAPAVLESIGVPVDNCIEASSTSSFAAGSSALPNCQIAGTCRQGAAGTATPYAAGGGGLSTLGSGSGGTLPAPKPKPWDNLPTYVPEAP